MSYVANLCAATALGHVGNVGRALVVAAAMAISMCVCVCAMEACPECVFMSKQMTNIIDYSYVCVSVGCVLDHH